MQQHNVNRHRQRFISCTAKLDAMSPLKVLTRGYAMAQTADGGMIHSVHQLSQGDPIRVTVCDGTILASVTGKEENLQ